jgi:hypothetical protein
MLASFLSWTPIVASRAVMAVACTLVFGLGLIEADAPSAAVVADSAAVTGTWRLQRYGTHVLTTHPDGTATMQMKMNRLAALSYGKELRLDLRWTMEEGVLTKRVVGGSPESAVARLIRDYGDTYDYRILEQTSDYLLVEDLASPGTPVRWEAGSSL